MMLSRPFSFIACASLLLFGAGCVDFGLSPSTSSATDGAMFRLTLANMNWEHLKVLEATPKPTSIASLDISAIAIDPKTPTTIYAGTKANGMLISKNNGALWTKPKAMEIKSGHIYAININPKAPCTLIIAKSNQLLKSTDCAETWTQISYDPRPEKVFTTLAIDWFNPSIIYAGTNDGDVYQSKDEGNAWKSIARVDEVRITSIAIHPKDSRVIAISADGEGVLKSTDAGVHWTTIKKEFSEFGLARRVAQVTFDPQNTKIIYTASRYGILKSTNGGIKWNALVLSTPTGSVDIRSIAIHPTNSKIIVYATDSSFGMSIDGGSTWKTRKLPTTRGVSTVLFDRSNPQNILIGAYTTKK